MQLSCRRQIQAKPGSASGVTSYAFGPLRASAPHGRIKGVPATKNVVTDHEQGIIACGSSRSGVAKSTKRLTRGVRRINLAAGDLQWMSETGAHQEYIGHVHPHRVRQFIGVEDKWQLSATNHRSEHTRSIETIDVQDDGRVQHFFR